MPATVHPFPAVYFAEPYIHPSFHLQNEKPPLFMENKLYKWLKAYDMIDTIICPSEFLKDKLDKDNILKKKTVVLHNFVDKAEIPVDKKDKKYVVYFGRFSKEKGIETLLKVVKRLPEMDFVFIGNGPLGEEVNQYKNIKNLGFMTGSNLYEKIAGAAFSIFPSECFENCPFSVMESIIYGTPVLGADIGGVKELLEDRKNGELFVSGSEEQLFEGIKKFWNDEELLKKYTDGCKSHTFDTTQEYCKKLLELYS